MLIEAEMGCKVNVEKFRITYFMKVLNNVIWYAES